ncbi:type III effector protein [Ralstonia nicotianae]|nr:RipZ-effector family protein [Ralstonia solanacearum]
MPRFSNCFIPTAHKPSSATPVSDTAAPTSGPEPTPAAAPAQPRPPRSARGTLKDRLKQMAHLKHVPHKPAISVDHWDEHATLKLCEQWRTGQARQPSVPDLARLAALNFERAHANSIPADQKARRLLPEGTSESVYYQAMIETFLKAVGIEDNDVAATLESFKKVGTGGLHRQPVSIASAVGGAVSTAQYAVAANLPAKTALSGVQLLLTLLTTQLAFDSADLRFRNAGTEEVMPLGRADTTPSAKTGPNVLRTTGRLAWDLRKIRTNVSQMEKAQAALDGAQNAYDKAQATIAAAREALKAAQNALAAAQATPAAPKVTLFQHMLAESAITQAKTDIEQATRKIGQGQEAAGQAEHAIQAAGETLKIAFARFCMRNELKSDYKTASESAKVEYHGNKRFLGISVATGAANLTATILGILTPVVVSATVTTGVTAAAAALAAVLYVGYQLSSGPSKDGEAKAKRAIVALAKSLDLLAGNAAKQQKARAAAYRTYIAERRIWNRPEVRKNAKPKLVATLDEIARKDTTEHDLDPLKNWLGYAKHREAMEAAGNDHDAARAIEEAFSQAHGARFSAKTVADAWKTPERMRFDSMGRLLLGKLGNAIGAVHKFNAETERAAPGESAREAFARRQIHAGRLADVKACLRDWISFEQAQSQMKSALQEKDPDQARTLLRGAAQALAAVRDTDAQNLFSRDGRKQVEATELAKRMTIGERERYTMTNAGPAALAGLVNIGGAAASLGLNIEKVVAESHGISMPAQYGDQNDARTLAQGSAPVTAPYVAAERARFQKTRMGKTVKTLARKQDDHVALKLELPAGKPMAPNTDYAAPDIDQALDKLIGQLEDLRDIPDEIQLSIGGKALPSGKLSGTTGYLNWRYDNAPLQTKAKFQMRMMEMVADNLAISVASPIAQGIAQVPLSMTRAAAHRGNAMSADVRDHLTRLAGQPADPQPSPEHPPAGTQPVPQAEPPASPRRSAPVAQAQPEQRQPAPGRVPGDFDPSAARHALSDVPMLGGEAPADAPAAPAALADAVFQPRPAGDPHAEAVVQQRRMLVGSQGADATHQWLEARGIAAAPNSGATSMDCLIISLLQHATSRYDAASEPALAREAARYRTALALQHPEILSGDRMLYADEPATGALIKMINETQQVSLQLQMVLPTDDGPVQLPSPKTGHDPVGVVLFGNHFQALHQTHRDQDRTADALGANAGARDAQDSGRRIAGDAVGQPVPSTAGASPQRNAAGTPPRGPQGGTPDIGPGDDAVSDDDFYSATASLSSVASGSESERDIEDAMRRAGRHDSADTGKQARPERPKPQADAAPAPATASPPAKRPNRMIRWLSKTLKGKPKPDVQQTAAPADQQPPSMRR